MSAIIYAVFFLFSMRNLVAWTRGDGEFYAAKATVLAGAIVFMLRLAQSNGQLRLRVDRRLHWLLVVFLFWGIVHGLVGMASGNESFYLAADLAGWGVIPIWIWMLAVKPSESVIWRLIWIDIAASVLVMAAAQGMVRLGLLIARVPPLSPATSAVVIASLLTEAKHRWLWLGALVAVVYIDFVVAQSRGFFFVQTFAAFCLGIVLMAIRTRHGLGRKTRGAAVRLAGAFLLLGLGLYASIGRHAKELYDSTFTGGAYASAVAGLFGLSARLDDSATQRLYEIYAQYQSFATQASWPEFFFGFGAGAQYDDPLGLMAESVHHGHFAPMVVMTRSGIVGLVILGGFFLLYVLMSADVCRGLAVSTKSPGELAALTRIFLVAVYVQGANFAILLFAQEFYWNVLWSVCFFMLAFVQVRLRERPGSAGRPVALAWAGA